MTKSNLMQIAPINYWERRFAGAKSKVDLDAAQHFLIYNCLKVGPFDAKIIRGSGAWMDDEKILVHTGSELLIEGEKIPIKEYNSEYVYQIGADLGFGDGTPLKTNEMGVLIEKIKWLSWEREIDAYLLAGWCVIAPFCGVLSWRSHIWITGSAGTGKSWVMENMVRRLLGSIRVAGQDNNTEAGGRGLLQSDSRPVLFDEADVDNFADKENIQGGLA